jgi:hypothetical protein
MDPQSPSSWARANPPQSPEPHAFPTSTSTNLSFRELLNSSPKVQHAQPTPHDAGLHSQYETAWTTLAKPPAPPVAEQGDHRRQEQSLPIPEDRPNPPPIENSPTLSVHSPTSQPEKQPPGKAHCKPYKPGHFECPFSRRRADNPSARLCRTVFKTRRSVRHPEAVDNGLTWQMKYHLLGLRGSGGDACHRLNDPHWESDDVRKWLRMSKTEEFEAPALPAPIPARREIGLDSRMGIEMGDRTRNNAWGYTGLTPSVMAVERIGQGAGADRRASGQGHEHTQLELIRLIDRHTELVDRHMELADRHEELAVEQKKQAMEQKELAMENLQLASQFRYYLKSLSL